MTLYGITNLEKAEIDHWLEFSLTSLGQQQNADVSTSLDRLEAVLGPRMYLVGYDLSLADLAVYSSLRGKGCKNAGVYTVDDHYHVHCLDDVILLLCQQQNLLFFFCYLCMQHWECLSRLIRTSIDGLTSVPAKSRFK